MRPSYRFASQYANEVPRIPPPTIVTSQGSMVRFRGTVRSLLCLCPCSGKASGLPSDLDPDGSDGPVERDRRIRDAPLQLPVRPETQADVVLHDAVVQHARFRRLVQADCGVADPCTLRPRLPQHPVQELSVFGSSRFDDAPGSDSEPWADDRMSCEWNGVRPTNLSVHGFRADG